MPLAPSLLLVDDDDPVRALIRTLLVRRGIDVDVAQNGVEAMEKIRAGRYLLVLLDLMMPQMSGYAVLELLTSMPPHLRPCVLIITAGAEPIHLDQQFVMGVVQKPFDIDVLADTILSSLSRAASWPGRCEAGGAGMQAEHAGKPN